MDEKEREYLMRILFGSPGAAAGKRIVQAGEDMAVASEQERLEREAKRDRRALYFSQYNIPEAVRKTHAMDIPGAREALAPSDIEQFSDEELSRYGMFTEPAETKLILRILENAKRQKPDAQRLAHPTKKWQAL